VRKRIALFTLCVAGLLVVVTLLAFTYAPNIIAAGSFATNLGHPAQLDTNAANGDRITIDNGDSTQRLVGSSAYRTRSECDGHAADSASTGY
jgi:hypothetical protein